MKVFILTVIKFNRYWNLPFYNYALSLQYLFKKKNIECTLVSGEDEVGENDLFIVFMPYLYKIKKIYNNLIVINSESIYTPSQNINITNYLKENIFNIKLILDYSYQNINYVKKISNIPIKFCPPIYCPVIENKVDNNQEKEYDIFFYGALNNRRKNILNQLQKKYNVKKYCNSDNDKLYDLMGKSKITIIIHFYEKDLCYDFYRISFLLSNKVFFIQEDVQQDDKIINLDIPLTNYNDFVNECDKYINMTQEERNQICEKNYQYFKKNFNLENYFIIDELLK